MPYLTPNSAPANSFVCRRVFIPNNLDFLMLVNGALSELCFEYNFEQFGDLTPDETAQIFRDMFTRYIRSNACMLGMILPFASATLPPDCLECDGSVYNRVDYPDLYSVLHPSLILNEDQFQTPNLIQRVVMGASGDMGVQPAHELLGEAEVTLTEDQMPEHSHTNLPHSHTTLPHTHADGIAVPTIINGGIEAPAASTTPGVSITSAETVIVNDSSITINNTGLGEAHNNIQPSYTLRYCMIAR